MSSLLSRVCAAGLLLLLAACAGTPTPFEPAPVPDGFGYSVTQLETNRFRIGFNGNSLTPHQTVDDNLLFLAAQVTIHNGGDWFILTRADSDKSTVYPTFVTPPPIYYGGYAGPGMFGGVTTDFNNPQDYWHEAASIVIYRGQKSATDPNAYDARDVAAHLGPHLPRGQPGPY